jgi:HSP20 family protein
MEQKNEVKIEKPSFASASAKATADKKATEDKEKWAGFSKDQEGQLAIDVYQTEESLVLQSAIAGVKPESLDINIEGDMVSIKGNREKPEEKAERNYSYQECFWGPFSRQIILPVEVDPARAEALLKEGILTIRLPRIERDKKRKLVVRG